MSETSNLASPARRVPWNKGKLWLHEIKHDGYRLIVQRDGGRAGSATSQNRDIFSEIRWYHRFKGRSRTNAV